MMYAIFQTFPNVARVFKAGLTPQLERSGPHVASEINQMRQLLYVVQHSQSSVV